MATPIIILSGYLGSGKTTLVQHILKKTDKKLAIIINEFGDIGVDTETIQKENINVKEILEGCVCCSLVGELDAAVKEIIEEYQPDAIIVETTGIAEPDAIMVSIDKDIKEVKLDCVITIIDSDIMTRFPKINNTSKIQIEAADILIINKTDLVTIEQLNQIKQKLQEINIRAKRLESTYCQVDVDILLNTELEHHIKHKHHPHNNKMKHLTIESPKNLTKQQFEKYLKNLSKEIFRAKGYITLENKHYLMNYVSGRYTLEEVKTNKQNTLVFIGNELEKEKLNPSL